MACLKDDGSVSKEYDKMIDWYEPLRLEYERTDESGYGVVYIFGGKEWLESWVREQW